MPEEIPFPWYLFYRSVRECPLICEMCGLPLQWISDDCGFFSWWCYPCFMDKMKQEALDHILSCPCSNCDMVRHEIGSEVVVKEVKTSLSNLDEEDLIEDFLDAMDEGDTNGPFLVI